MEKKSYTYGSKLAGMILHLFFTVILTIAVYLLASLISKNILQVTDIGTDDFFNSGYYTKCMEQKCSELTDYLHLLQKGDKRSAEDDKRYLQYTNEFKREDTNFCYWYKQNGVWYTNQPDSVEGQEFDTQTVLMEAKTMGDYLLYDMEKKEFGTDIRGMENYFFGSYNNQMYLPLENVVLVIGVDTDLTAKDDLYDAEMEYVRLHPWIKVSIVARHPSGRRWREGLRRHGHWLHRFRRGCGWAYEHLGADAIGMSTVPEVIAANYLGMAVLGIACITNMATGIAREKHSHQEVLRIANESSQRLCALVERVVREL